jgi:hypothetical protein
MPIAAGVGTLITVLIIIIVVVVIFALIRALFGLR